MRNKSTKKVYSDRTVYDYALLCKRIFTGADPEGAHPARAPPKIGKNMIFLA
jgi:hypothetical protein